LAPNPTAPLNADMSRRRSSPSQGSRPVWTGCGFRRATAAWMDRRRRLCALNDMRTSAKDVMARRPVSIVAMRGNRLSGRTPPTAAGEDDACPNFVNTEIACAPGQREEGRGRRGARAPSQGRKKGGVNVDLPNTTAHVRHRTERIEPRRGEDAKGRRSKPSVFAFVLASRLRAFAVQIYAIATKVRCSTDCGDRATSGTSEREGPQLIRAETWPRVEATQQHGPRSGGPNSPLTAWPPRRRSRSWARRR
jgi:hypothetical protein